MIAVGGTPAGRAAQAAGAWWRPGGWQRCPVCGGTGQMSRAFYHGPYASGETGTGPVVCRSCHGRGIIR